MAYQVKITDELIDKVLDLYGRCVKETPEGKIPKWVVVTENDYVGIECGLKDEDGDDLNIVADLKQPTAELLTMLYNIGPELLACAKAVLITRALGPKNASRN